MTIDSGTVGGTELIQAENSITLAGVGSYILEPGSNVTVEAGQQITLLPGFHAKEGAQGLFKITEGLTVNQTTTLSDVTLKEHHIYGSSRLGIQNADFNETALEPNNYKSNIGDKRYELSNHLNNVLSVVSDKKMLSYVPTYTIESEDIDDLEWDNGTVTNNELNINGPADVIMGEYPLDKGTWRISFDLDDMTGEAEFIISTNDDINDTNSMLYRAKASGAHSTSITLDTNQGLFYFFKLSGESSYQMVVSDFKIEDEVSGLSTETHSTDFTLSLIHI